MRRSANRTALGLGLSVLVAVVACGRDAGPRVEELSSAGASLLPVELMSSSGTRDGALTRARFVFGGGTDLQLTLELTVAVDPQPTLESGRWDYAGPTGRGSGDVQPESIRFVGGQGEGASVGGVFLLRDAGTPRFRVELPLTSLASRPYE